MLYLELGYLQEQGGCYDVITMNEKKLRDDVEKLLTAVIGGTHFKAGCWEGKNIKEFSQKGDFKDVKYIAAEYGLISDGFLH